MMTERKFEFGYLPDPYASHLGLLAACFALTGPLGYTLEVGGGLYSTAMLHGLCLGTRTTVGRRGMMTLENHRDWYEFLKKKYPEPANTFVYHQVVFSERFAEDDLVGGCWKLVFVDNDPAADRAGVLNRLHPGALVVMHDTQDLGDAFNDHFQRFKYRLRYAEPPWPLETTAATNDPELMLRLREIYPDAMYSERP